MFNGNTTTRVGPHDKWASHNSAASTAPSSPAFAIDGREKVALVATLAPFPSSELILKKLSEHAEGLGYEVCGQVELLDDGRRVRLHGTPATGLIPETFPVFRGLREAWGSEVLVLTDTTPAPVTEASLVATWRAVLGSLKREVVDLERQQTAPPSGPHTADGPALPSSKWIFEQYAREVAGPNWENLKVKERPHELKTLLKAEKKFIDTFPSVPLDWPPIRDWLHTTWPGDSGRTRRNMFDVLKRMFK